MLVFVYLFSSTDMGDVRVVEISDHWKGVDDYAVFGAIWKYGQNDFQPKEMPSVSMGDVIQWKGEYFLIGSCNYIKIDVSFLMNYMAMNRRDRLDHALNLR